MAPPPSVPDQNLFAPSLQTSKVVVTMQAIAGSTQLVVLTPIPVHAPVNLVWLGKLVDDLYKGKAGLVVLCTHEAHKVL